MIENYNPDVLTCLANLSNDEVFTPPNIANQILDLLPSEIWRDKNATFLDPACKSGEVGINPEKGYRSISTPQILTPGQVDTFSYLNIGFFDTREEAENLVSYVNCKFTRYLIRTTYSSVHVSKDNFKFVPLVDLKRSWTDKALYSYFGLTDDEVNIIEKTMRPMKTVGGEDDGK